MREKCRSILKIQRWDIFSVMNAVLWRKEEIILSVNGIIRNDWHY